jgi:hypothetical protein
LCIINKDLHKVKACFLYHHPCPYCLSAAPVHGRPKRLRHQANSFKTHGGIQRQGQLPSADGIGYRRGVPAQFAIGSEFLEGRIVNAGLDAFLLHGFDDSHAVNPHKSHPANGRNPQSDKGLAPFQ